MTGKKSVKPEKIKMLKWNSIPTVFDEDDYTGLNTSRATQVETSYNVLEELFGKPNSPEWVDKKAYVWTVVTNINGRDVRFEIAPWAFKPKKSEVFSFSVHMQTKDRMGIMKDDNPDFDVTPEEKELIVKELPLFIQNHMTMKKNPNIINTDWGILRGFDGFSDNMIISIDGVKVLNSKKDDGEGMTTWTLEDGSSVEEESMKMKKAIIGVDLSTTTKEWNDYCKSELDGDHIINKDIAKKTGKKI